jgi:uncharacterized surface protein with fasciclin (FAS1) repeats
LSQTSCAVFFFLFDDIKTRVNQHGALSFCELAPRLLYSLVVSENQKLVKGEKMKTINAAVLALALSAGLGGAATAQSIHDKDIVQIAVSAGSFKTMVAAVQAADLVEVLKSDGPFTVFAPTDEAFNKLPAGTVENLLKPENKQKLVAILTYHVVAGRVNAADVVSLSSAKTVNGQDLSISAKNGSVMVDKARVTGTDIMASNGIIYVIDTVILPR